MEGEKTATGNYYVVLKAAKQKPQPTTWGTENWHTYKYSSYKCFIEVLCSFDNGCIDDSK